MPSETTQDGESVPIPDEPKWSIDTTVPYSKPVPLNIAARYADATLDLQAYKGALDMANRRAAFAEAALAAEHKPKFKLCPKCDWPYFPISDGPTEYVCVVCHLEKKCQEAEDKLAAEHTRGWNEAIEAAIGIVWMENALDVPEHIRALRKPDTREGVDNELA